MTPEEFHNRHRDRFPLVTQTLAQADYNAMVEDIETAPEPTDKLRALMREPCKLWDGTLSEAIPDDMKDLLAKLK